MFSGSPNGGLVYLLVRDLRSFLAKIYMKRARNSIGKAVLSTTKRCAIMDVNKWRY